MPEIITTPSGAVIRNVRESIGPNQNGGTYQVRVYCKPGYRIKSSVDPDVQVMVRRAGTGQAFVDVAVAPIELSAFANTYQTFDVYSHVDSDAARYSSHVLELQITPRLS